MPLGSTALEVLDRFRGGDRSGRDTCCQCRYTFEDDRLVVDATDCPERGQLGESAECRRVVIDALTRRDAETILTHSSGIDRIYDDRAAALLVAAGRFVERVDVHDAELAEMARTDPLHACRSATARTPPVSRIAAETGLASVVESVEGYESALRPELRSTVARARVEAGPPPNTTLVETRSLGTDSTARLYRDRSTGTRTYQLIPAFTELATTETQQLASAYDRLASGAIEGGDRAPARAIRDTCDSDGDIALLSRLLRKHTREFGVVTDLLSDPAVSDVFVTTPVESTPVRLLYEGDRLATNVRLTEQGVAAFASRFRRSSGRAFSRASPTLAATTSAGESAGSVRVAGVTDPVSDGTGFVFRDHGDEALTLPALVENDTLPADAAALLSVAVRGSGAGLIAGTRGAGKTTMLGALLWELPAGTRTVVIEDTPELPVEQLQETGRDVQALETAVDVEDGPGISPSEALRTALRLGEGALVLGEVRGEEARVLYEAMRVGASGSAVLGTIHGDGGQSVRERVVSDLNVPESSFAVTEFVVTLEPYQGPDGRARRVRSIEELLVTERGVTFAPLYELDGGDLVSTGRIGRGESRLVDSLARSDESYADLRNRLDHRQRVFDRLADSGRTRPQDVADAYARQSRSVDSGEI